MIDLQAHCKKLQLPNVATCQVNWLEVLGSLNRADQKRFLGLPIRQQRLLVRKYTDAIGDALGKELMLMFSGALRAAIFESGLLDGINQAAEQNYKEEGSKEYAKNE